MNNSFDNLFYSIFPKSNFDVKVAHTYTKNIGEFQKLAFLKHNCKYIYNHLSSAFGEDYGEKIIRGIIDGKFTISNAEKFTFKNFPYIEENLYLSVLNRGQTCNFLNVFGNIERHIFNKIRTGNSVIVPDLLIILSMVFSRFMERKRCGFASFKTKKERYKFAQQLIINFLNSISGMTGCMEDLVTIPILDATTFKDLTTQREMIYSFQEWNLDGLTGSFTVMARPKYKQYVKFVRLFLKCFTNLKGVKPCKIAYYIHSTRDIRTDVIDRITELTTIDRVIVGKNLRKVYLSESIDLDEPEYNEILEYLIRLNKGTLTLEQLKEEVYKVLKTEKDFLADRVTFDKLPLYKFICKTKIRTDKHLLVYHKRVNENTFENKRAEVILDFSKLVNDELTEDELMKSLTENYIDAQAINQTRLQVFKGVNYTDCRCNVKVIHIEEKFIPAVFNTLFKETKYLRNAYSINFTFEIEKEI